MIIPKNIELPPFLESRFDEMVIPGDGIGIAITREVSLECFGGAIGVSEKGGVAIKYQLDPFKTLKVRNLDRIELKTFTSLVSPQFKNTGVIFAEEHLDGESYYIKWVEHEYSTRLLITNPRCIDDEDLANCADRLDQFISLI